MHPSKKGGFFPYLPCAVFVSFAGLFRARISTAFVATSTFKNNSNNNSSNNSNNNSQNYSQNNSQNNSQNRPLLLRLSFLIGLKTTNIVSFHQFFLVLIGYGKHMSFSF